MARVGTNRSVFDATLERIAQCFEMGEVVVSFSGGKDSTVMLECARIVARRIGKLPLTVIMNDEEIMYPGVYEYAERIANDPDFDFHWVYMNNPNLNPFNRENPYWWAFDPTIPEHEWVRKYPDYAYKVHEIDLYYLVTENRFNFGDSDIIDLVGLRSQESPKRAMTIASCGGRFYTGRWTSYSDGVPEHVKPALRSAWPIYDWRHGDVWKAIKEFNWDYCSTYDVMFKMGMKSRELRIAPITMNGAAIDQLSVVYRAFPHWFDKACKRLPGLRTAAKFGSKVVNPQRRLGETWEQCFYRTCVEEAPKWIADRAMLTKTKVLSRHAKHSTTPFPDVAACKSCGLISSWAKLTFHMYDGDPFSAYCGLPYVEPEFFRKGAGTFAGSVRDNLANNLSKREELYGSVVEGVKSE